MLRRRRIRDRNRHRPNALPYDAPSKNFSSLLREIAVKSNSVVIDLDDRATRWPQTPPYLWGGDGLVCVDEYQKAPLVLDAIKAELNRDTTPRRYLLAGSTRYETLPEAAQSLTGRLSRVQIQPFTQAEIDCVNNYLLQQLFDDPASLITTATSTTNRDEYIHRIVRGGFPLAIGRHAPSSRSRWFVDYIRLTLERDAGSDIGLSAVTVESYTRILEAVFLIQQLPACLEHHTY